MTRTSCQWSVAVSSQLSAVRLYSSISATNAHKLRGLQDGEIALAHGLRRAHHNFGADRQGDGHGHHGVVMRAASSGRSAVLMADEGATFLQQTRAEEEERRTRQHGGEVLQHARTRSRSGEPSGRAITGI